MYSAVFAIDPASAADLVLAFDQHNLRDAEVMDVDENAYRAGNLKTRLYGIARTPALAGKIQVAKQVYEEQDEERAKAAIAQFIDEIMLPGTLYIIGAGTTTEAIARRLSIKKTLLGVDAIRDRRPVAADCDEKTLLALVDKSPDTRIILSPIGAQGFILGRGNQQISARLVRKIGMKNLIVIATPHKLAQTPRLYIDSGDALLTANSGTQFRSSRDTGSRNVRKSINKEWIRHYPRKRLKRVSGFFRCFRVRQHCKRDDKANHCEDHNVGKYANI